HGCGCCRCWCADRPSGRGHSGNRSDQLSGSSKKKAAGGGTDRSNRLELDLAGVLPRSRRVGGLGAVDVEQVLDPDHAWHFQHGLLDARNLERVLDLAADRDDAGLDVEVDLTLRQLGIPKDLAFDSVAQDEVVGWAWARSQAHHPLRKRGRVRAGPRSQLVAPPPSEKK